MGQIKNVGALSVYRSHYLLKALINSVADHRIRVMKVAQRAFDYRK